MARKILSLLFLVLSVDADWERADSACTESEPFFIRNRFRSHSYLTVNLKTNAVNAVENTGTLRQQWMWRACGNSDEKLLVNLATGGCLTKKKKMGLVSSKCKGKWQFNEKVGTLQEVKSGSWARLDKKKNKLVFVPQKKIKYIKGTETPLDWFRWEIEFLDTSTTYPITNPTTNPSTNPPYKVQPEDPGCYESACPPGCQLVLISKLNNPLGGLYYGVPALESYEAVSSNTRLYKSTAQSAVGATGNFASTYFLFHHNRLNMWVIGKDENALIDPHSSNVLAKSGKSESKVVPEEEDGKAWTWEGITPICFDDNKCSLSVPDQTSRSLMHQSYPFSENRNGKIVTQFTYKGETYEASGRTDSEGALIFANRGVPMDLPINGRNNQEAYRVLSFSEQEGFQDLEDFNPTLALTDRLNDDRHLQTAAIHAGLSIPASSGLSSWKWKSGSATSWELRMDITVTHSANGTFFKTVGWQPGGYSGIQQKPDTYIAKSGKNFIFSMWDTNTDNWGNADEGTIPSYSYVDELNDNADLGGEIGIWQRQFSGEGTGQQIQVDYPWATGDTSTIIIRGSRPSVDSDEWCVSSGLVRSGMTEEFLARFCRKSPEDVLLDWGFSVFIEDWLGFMNCNRVGYDKVTKWMNFKKQRAAIFSNWKVIVDGKEVETAAPKFQVNLKGHARGLSDAGMLGEKAFFISTGGWKYDAFVP